MKYCLLVWKGPNVHCIGEDKVWSNCGGGIATRCTHRKI